MKTKLKTALTYLKLSIKYCHYNSLYFFRLLIVSIIVSLGFFACTSVNINDDYTPNPNIPSQGSSAPIARISVPVDGGETNNETEINGNTTTNSSTYTTPTIDPTNLEDLDGDGHPDDVDPNDDGDRLNDDVDCAPRDPDPLSSWDTDKDGNCDDKDPVFSQNEWIIAKGDTADKVINFKLQGKYDIQLTPFYILKNEVSATDYNKCVTSGSCINANLANSKFPVVKINWENAQKFCKWVGGDLPTEAQWEYAATGGLDRKYPWGNNAKKNEANIGEEKATRKVEPVGIYEKGKSPLGLYDMLGNVLEWMRDVARDDFFTCLKSENCSLGIKISNRNPWNEWKVADYYYRTIRGFSFYDLWKQIERVNPYPVRARLASDERNMKGPFTAMTGNKSIRDYSDQLGFRCVLEF